MALTLKKYVVPLVNPVISYEVVEIPLTVVEALDAPKYSFFVACSISYDSAEFTLSHSNLTDVADVALQLFIEDGALGLVLTACE